MSKDLPAYLTMTASTSSSAFNDEYLPQNDAAELQRLHAPYAAAGLGDTLYMDEETVGLLDDFGLGFDVARDANDSTRH